MAEKGTVNTIIASAIKFALSVADKDIMDVLKTLGPLLGVSGAATAVLLNIIQEIRRTERKEKKVLESEKNVAFQEIKNKIEALQEDLKKTKESTKHEVQLLRAELAEQGKKEILEAMESMLKMQLGPLSQKLQTLEEDVQKWQETTKHDIQKMRADLEKDKGKKEILEAVESMLKMELGPLSQKFQTLEEDVQKWQETTKHDIQKIRDELEEQGKKEKETARELESMLDNKLQQLSQNFKALEEDVQQWQVTTKCEVQLLRAELAEQGNKVEETSRELESMLDNKFGQLSQKIQALEEDVQKWQETTKCEVQLLRAELENRGKKEDERSMALQCRMDMLLQQVSQGFQTLEQTLQWRQEVPYLEFQLFQAYLENNQGIAMLREETIHRRVLELAGGERINNICTDSRSAFGIEPAQGAVCNRRLREARGFFRSVSGGEVQRITPGSSDNLHANQDQRTACLGSLCRSIEGIQRSMDIRASRTNNLQVVMLTLGVLISIVILARIFTLPWPWSPHSHQLLL